MNQTQQDQHNEWMNWIKTLHENDQDAHWFWITIKPRTDVFKDVMTRSQADTLEPQELVDRTSRTTAMRVKTAIHQTLIELDPAFSRNHPERTRASAKVAAFLVPAVTTGGRRIHYHGWIRCVLPSPSELDEVVIRQDRAPRRALCPRPCAVLLRHLIDAFGTNIHLENDRHAERPCLVVPETPALLSEHADYLRPAPAVEARCVSQPIAQPGWYWKAALAAVA